MFAAFRLPGQQAEVYIQRDGQLRPPQPGQRCFVLAPFNGTDGTAMCIRPDEALRLDSDPHLPESVIEAKRHSKDPARGMDRADYRRAVERAILSIRSGEVEKLVLARTIDAHVNGLSIGALFAAATQALPEAFVAITHTQQFGLWLGASPERLLTEREKQVEVDALAGTMAAERAPNEASEWGIKEREEQAIVTRMILSELMGAGVDDLVSSDVSVKRAGPVAHLHTRVTGRLNETSALDLAKALHPTPAVGGTPTHAAIDLIRRLEPRSRSLYAGYWGPMHADGADLFVNIRCMEVFKDQALLHVGAGITRDSDPDRECDEVERKARTWLDLIDAQRAAG
ncbi:MAG TPA: chorismate-binding protein [Flavobacteriales bacterium]|nr:chorismate-binding protein [Flavobacteriales bacterium]